MRAIFLPGRANDLTARIIRKLPNLAAAQAELACLVRRQIVSAERLVQLRRTGRVKLRRYEARVEIEG